MTQIFLSYSREDRPRVASAAEYLTTQSYQVLWDYELTLGAWQPQIDDFIDKSSLVLFFLSKNTKHDGWSAVEFRAASAKGTVIVPILLTRVESNLFNTQVMAFNYVSWEDKSRPFSDVFSEVVNMRFPLPNREPDGER